MDQTSREAGGEEVKKTRTVVEERIIEEWECDMCGAVNKTGTVTLIAAEHPGLYSWDIADLCGACRVYVHRFIFDQRKRLDGQKGKK